MRKTLTALVIAASFPALAFAEDAPPPPKPITGPEGVFVPYSDLQALAEKMGDVPYKYAAPVLAEIQHIVEKNQPPKPPAQAPAKK